MDYITLLGAEQVQSAGCAMREAASQFSSTMYGFDNTVDRLIRALDEHAQRVDKPTHQDLEQTFEPDPWVIIEEAYRCCNDPRTIKILRDALNARAFYHG